MGVIDRALDRACGIHRCNHPEVMAEAAGSRWALTSLRYYQAIAYPGVDPAEVAADYAEAVRRLTAVCGLTVIEAADPSQAQIIAVQGPIDGPWNVLALSELPPPDAGPITVLHQTFDVAETALTRDQRKAMMAHEFGHCLGLGHAPQGSGNLMEPILSTIGSPQAGDIAELQARYGPPANANTTGTPTPAPAPADQGYEPVEIPLPNGGTLVVTFTFRSH